MKTVNGTGRHGSQPPSLTGRDGYIVGQALYWFIREQQKLPKGKRPGISIAGLIATVYGGNATAATIKAHVAQANDLLASSSERIARERGSYRIVTTPGASW